MDRYGELREAAEKAPIVDAHAHNLVAVDSALPFLRAFSEAEGDALLHTVHALSFKRSVRDIASLYGCGATLDDIEKYRRSHGLQSIATKCFAAANMSTLFVDDGIEFDKMHNWEWHSQFAPAVGRILRIEYLAEKILNEELANGSEITLESFSENFTTELKSVAGKVVSLKSIAAYRSGLEIDTQVSKKAAEEGLLEDFNGGKPIRIRNKNIIDYIFTSSLAVALLFNLPMQIHTGFGDKDLNLSKSNPLLLRGVLEDKRFSKCQFVLLHASYPYSREASYLSSVYSQVYLDFGLAVPKLSVHGMVSSVKELLELAPINKVMFSSDGYAFPETFYLGAKRAREVIYSVLSDACDSGDFTIVEAIEATEKIFWKNALELYSFQKVIGSFDYKSSLTISPKGKSQEYDTMVVRVIWVDNSGQHRCRVIPTKRFYEVVKNIGVGLTVASMGMSSHCDGPSDGSGLTAVGEIRLVPDLSTIQNIPWINQEEMVLADMRLPSSGSWEYCPRDTLRRVSQTLKEEFNLVMNAGFENEFYLLRKTVRETEEWVSFDSTLYSSTCGFDAASPILKEILSSLHSMGIFVDQMHAESGNGQFEIVLGHKVCHLAADDLIFAREAIKAVARKHGLLATFLPKFSLDSVGSGCHVHLSLWKDGKNVFMASDLSETPYGVSKIGENFMAGVFHHLPSILAIISPLPNSYDRIQPDTWSGAYHCWGTENREAPIRIACHPGSSTGVASNFEIKSFDGCANPHIGLASILAAGIDGLRKNLALPQPTNINPSGCDSKVPKLPKDLSESIAALEGDTVLHNSLGEKLVKAIIGVRRAEIKYYSTNGRAIEQLIHKY